MKKQSRFQIFRCPGFYLVLAAVLLLLLIADITLGLLPVESGVNSRELPVSENIGSGEFPKGMENFEAKERPTADFEGTASAGERWNQQPASPLRWIRSHWLVIAVCLAVLDGLSILMWVRTRKKAKRRNEPEGKVRISSDGQVHLVKKASGRKRSPWWVAAPAAILLVLALVVHFISGAGTVQIPQTQASIHSGTAQSGSLSVVLPGSGTLTAEASEAVSLVDTVELKQWYVGDGDLVKEGDILASVDRVSVMSAIANIQDTLEALDNALSGCETETLDTVLSAPVSGRVKEIYASEGAAVADTMYDRGALMLLSIDGLMAVSVETKTALSPGDSVIITLPDGENADGRVESVLGGTAVVTLSDDGPTRGDTVMVSLEDGTRVGSGELYIHSELKITAFSGTVDDILVAEGEKVASGRRLMTLADREYTGKYETLLLQRADLEEQMFTLFQLYQEGFLYAPCDGMVSGVEDYKAAHLSSDSGAMLHLLANAPGEDPDALYQNYVGIVTDMDGEALQLKVCPVPIGILDYSLVGELELSPDLMMESVAYTLDPDTAVYAYTDGGWTAGSVSGIAVGDTLLFAFSPDDGRLVFLISVAHGDGIGEEEPSPPEVNPGKEPGKGDNSETGESEKSDAGETSGDGEQSAQRPATGSTGNAAGSGGSAGAMPSGAPEEPEYTVTQTEILTITPQNTMTITITVDELDILSLEAGQTAQVTLDALPGQAFPGIVTEIGLESSNAGGNSKYTATVTIQRGENMLPGMNASVSVILDSQSDILLVPVDALTELDGKVYLYTAYEEKTDTLTGLTEVTTGLSDGLQVQILSGLREGDSYCYRYLDTVNYSVSSVQTGSTGFFFTSRSKR